jgi:hypothetical protein
MAKPKPRHLKSRPGGGHSFARIADILNDGRRYLAKRGIPHVRLLNIANTGRPVLHIAHTEALDRLDNVQYVGGDKWITQWGIFLTGFCIVWEKSRPDSGLSAREKGRIEAEVHRSERQQACPT